MKKILAIVLALVMVCTMAMAASYFDASDIELPSYNYFDPAYEYELVKAGGNYENGMGGTVAQEYYVKETQKDTKGNIVGVTMLSDKYVITEKASADAVLAVDKTVTYLMTVNTDADATYEMTLKQIKTTTVKSLSAIVNNIKNLKCGTIYVENGTTLYTNDKGEYFVICDSSSADDVAMVNGKFVYVEYVGDETDVMGSNFVKIPHVFTADVAKDGSLKNIKCLLCGKTIAKYADINKEADAVKLFGVDGYEYAVVVEDEFDGTISGLMANIPGSATEIWVAKADVAAIPAEVVGGNTTTNPDTGANDVIGVAAALAVVALVSGAAISLKK